MTLIQVIKVIDVIMLCETFLNNINCRLAKIEGYQSHHLMCGNKMGGGVSLLIKDGIKVKKTVHKSITECTEMLLIKVKLNHVLYVVGTLYRVPYSSLRSFLDDVKLFTNKIRKYKHIIIGADQNLHLLKTCQNDSKFVELMLDAELIPTLNKPTRVTHNSSMLIDNMYLKGDLTTKFESHIICDSMSDHYPCLLTLPIFRNTTEKLIETRKIDEDALLRINQRLLFTDWSLMHDMNINDSMTFLHDRITDTLDTFAPKEFKKVNYKQVFREPWMTVKLCKYNQKCRKLCKKACKSGNQDDFVRYREYRKVLNWVKQFEKRNFYKEVFSKIGKNTKMLWEVLNRVIKKTSNKVDITSVVSKGYKIEDPRKISDIFNKHFMKAGVETQKQIMKTANNPIASVPTSLMICKLALSQKKDLNEVVAMMALVIIC